MSTYFINVSDFETHFILHYYSVDKLSQDLKPALPNLSEWTRLCAILAWLKHTILSQEPQQTLLSNSDASKSHNLQSNHSLSRPYWIKL